MATHEVATGGEGDSYLDRGEAEAIEMALELDANELRIDERLGHGEAVSESYQLRILGILLFAKCRKLVSSAQSVLNDLIAQAGFQVRVQLHTESLIAVGKGFFNRSENG